MHGDHLFLDAALEHELVDGHRSRLADAMGAIGGLLFDRRVPPRIEMDDVVGSGQVDADATGLEAEQEHLALAALKCGHRFIACFLRRAAIEILVVDAFLVEARAHQTEKIDELRKHQGTMTVVGEFLHQLDQLFEFGTGYLQLGRDQIGMAGSAPQTGDFGEHLHASLFRRQAGVVQALQ